MEKHNVLVVNQDFKSLHTIFDYLEEEGSYNVMNATNAKMVQTIIRKKELDVVLLDWETSIASELEVYHYLQQQVSTREVPIVISTHPARTQTINEIITTDISAYVPKPIEKEVLIQGINQAIAGNKEAKAKKIAEQNALELAKQKVVEEQQRIVQEKEKVESNKYAIQEEQRRLKDELEQERAKLTETRTKLENEKEQINLNQTDIEATKGKIEETQEDLQQKSSQLQQEKEALLRDKEKFLSEKQAFAETKEQLVKEKEEALKTKHTQQEQFTRQNQALETSQTKLNTEQQRLTNEWKKLEAEQLRLQKESKQLTADKAKLAKDKEQLKTVVQASTSLKQVVTPPQKKTTSAEKAIQKETLSREEQEKEDVKLVLKYLEQVSDEHITLTPDVLELEREQLKLQREQVELEREQLNLERKQVAEERAQIQGKAARQTPEKTEDIPQETKQTSEKPQTPPIQQPAQVNTEVVQATKNDIQEDSQLKLEREQLRLEREQIENARQQLLKAKENFEQDRELFAQNKDRILLENTKAREKSNDLARVQKSVLAAKAQLSKIEEELTRKQAQLKLIEMEEKAASRTNSAIPAKIQESLQTSVANNSPLVDQGQSFSKLLEKEAARLHTSSLMQYILPEEIARDLDETDYDHVNYHPSVSILYIGFEDLMSAVLKTDRKQLIDELEVFFKAINDRVQQYGLERVRTKNNMYACAHRKLGTSDPLPLLRASLEIRQMALDYQAESKEVNQLIRKMYLGVNTTDVVAGDTQHKRFAYDIWSDIIQTTHHLKQNIDVPIHLLQNTYRLVGDQVKCQHVGKIRTNRRGDWQVYELMSIDK